MSIELITVLMVGSLLLLLLLGVPLAFALGFVAVAFAWAFFGWNAIQLIASRIYGFVNVYVLLSVPMFLLMAAIMDRSGVARDLYDAMSVWAGGLPGGVGAMTLVAAVFMAATTGIIGGEIILLGLVALPQMLRLRYDRNLAIGIICAGGSLGTMIPPSIVLIFYGLTANVPIGELFIAVVMPGLLLASIYLVYTLVRCGLRPELGPPLPAAERAMLARRQVPPARRPGPADGHRVRRARRDLYRHRRSVRGGRGRRRRQHRRRVGARHAHLAAAARLHAADHVHLRPAPLADLRRRRP